MKYMDRRTYAWIMVTLILGSMGAAFIPGFARMALPFNIAFLAVTALLTGARLAHAGYRRWLGIAGVPGIIIGLPFISAFIDAAVFRARADNIKPSVVVAATGLFFAFITWAGTRPGQQNPNDRFEQARMKGRFAATTASDDRLDRVLHRTPR